MSLLRRQKYLSGPIPSCFRPTTTTADDGNTQSDPAVPPPSSSAATNLMTTSLYHTRLGIFALTWSKNFLGRSLHLHLLPTATNQHRSISLPTPSSCNPVSSPSSSFQLVLKPFFFWTKRGSRKLPLSSSPTTSATVHYDLTRAKFGSSPEPDSGYHITVISPDGQIALSLGDDDFNSKPGGRSDAALVVRREHVQGAAMKSHKTKVELGGKTREVAIECDGGSPDPRLVVRFDSKKALQVKHLRWKFRGSERVEVDGFPVRISWDVRNWLFDAAVVPGGEGGGAEESSSDGGFALFTFRFEKRAADCDWEGGGGGVGERVTLWSEELSGLESRKLMTGRKKKKKKKKKNMKKTRSASSSSVSSASSSACGSVLEWESVEETELKGGPTAFELLVYAWRT